MRRFIHPFRLLGTMLGTILFVLTCATNAHAAVKVMFGTEEKILFVAPVELKTPDDKKLFLGRKLTFSAFLLPYSVSDDGFVMGLADDDGHYYSMPDAAELQAFQEAGLLPNPLPEWKLDIFDQLYGNMLWIVLVGLIIYIGILVRREKMKAKKAAALESQQSAERVQ